jgi:hypothetical protein
MAEKSTYTGPDVDTGFGAYYEKLRANKIAQRRNNPSERRRKLDESEESELVSKALRWYKDLSDKDKSSYRFDAERGATATADEKEQFQAELSQKYDMLGRRRESPQEQWKRYEDNIGRSGDVMITNTDGKRIVNPKYNQEIIEGYGKKNPTTGNNAKPVPEPSSNNGEVQVAGVANAEGKVGGSQPAGSAKSVETPKPAGSSPELKAKENKDPEGYGYTDSESYSAFKKTRPSAVQDYQDKFNQGAMGERLKDIQTAKDALELNSRYSTDDSAERKMSDARARNEYQDERERIKMEYDKGIRASDRRDEDARLLASGRTLKYDKERERNERGYIADRTQFADIDERMGEMRRVVTGREEKDGRTTTFLRNKDGSTASVSTTTQATEDKIDALRATRTKELIAGGMDEKSAKKQSSQDVRQIYAQGNIDDYNTTNGRPATKRADYTALDDKDRISAMARNNYDASKLDSDKEWQSVLAKRSGDKKIQDMSKDFDKQKMEMANAKPEVAKPYDFFKKDGSIDKSAFARVSDKPLEVPYKGNAPATDSKPIQAPKTPQYEGDVGYKGPSDMPKAETQSASKEPELNDFQKMYVEEAQKAIAKDPSVAQTMATNQSGKAGGFKSGIDAEQTKELMAIDTKASQPTISAPKQVASTPKYEGPDASGGTSDANDLARKKKKNPNEGPMIA